MKNDREPTQEELERFWEWCGFIVTPYEMNLLSVLGQIVPVVVYGSLSYDRRCRNEGHTFQALYLGNECMGVGLQV